MDVAEELGTTEGRMGISLSTNMAALTASRQLSMTSASLTSSLERLSSGYRINRASDDPSGLAISESLRSQARGMGQSLRNAQDGVSVVQIAEGALGETTTILQRMRDLTVQAANDGALGANGRAAVQKEIQQLKLDLGRIADSTQFDGTRLLDGSYNRSFQVGANVGETIPVAIGRPGQRMDAAGLGVSAIDVTGATGGPTANETPAKSAAQGVPTAGRLDLSGDYTTAGTYQASFTGLRGTVTYNGNTFDLGSVDYTGAVTATDYLDKLNQAAQPVLGTSTWPFTGSATALTFTGDVPSGTSTPADAMSLSPSYAKSTGASDAITAIDDAINQVSLTRADLGAIQNRFEDTVDRVSVSLQNTTESESRIRDADVAQEMSTYTRNSILTQAGTAMLTQATHAPEALLKLLN
jgi:flagellin-like hook-associated protein FlgL